MNNTDTICAYPWTWFSFNVDYGMWRACPRSEYRWFQTESEVDNFFNTKTEQKKDFKMKKHPFIPQVHMVSQNVLHTG